MIERQFAQTAIALADGYRAALEVAYAAMRRNGWHLAAASDQDGAAEAQAAYDAVAEALGHA
ncbi:conserved protein of unknown function (plasmid) [Rhodovastum atsumiense]|uniref:Uncharacterized protein n=1 Tax=Rhodovastum atsumiense TaxID=504468 RepID=A0A5M6IVX7_9PROT|nr:hypothetical protein [Rhodovastum atsumiense]KAA5611648.1 hypothetical protein F1189_13895 [Rhodovastum atsumiense]CAH2606254.1 conserved protein of unknown function [Rhodovastum atsumiense]